jgi:DNA invertase Pin-like site-specific DNA recombinase
MVKPSFRVGAYVRLSAVDRKQKGDSIENQQAIINAFIEEKAELELSEVYIDNGLTGQTVERPAFQRMLTDLENGKINCCVTKDLSRLGRNAIDTGYYIEKYFPTRNIRYIAINDNYDSADGSTGGIMVSLKNMVNEAYALEIGRKIRTTKQMNIKNGAFVGRFAPYGYSKNKTDSHKLVTDEYAASIVRQIFEKAADGHAITTITEWLNESGVLPPRRYFHSLGLATEKEAGGHIHWNKGVVYTILKNRVYVGDMVQGKYSTKEHIQVKLPKSEWVITENTHEAIISRELFTKIQALYSGGKKTMKKNGSENILRRKVFCGHCGYTMHRAKYKHAHGFSCATRRNYSKDDCKVVSINEDILKEILLESLRKQSAVLADIMPATVVKTHDSNEIWRVQADIERNTGFLKGLYESLISGDITREDYRDLKLSYESKIASLSEQESILRESARLAALEAAKRNKAADNIGTVFDSGGLTAEAVDALIEKILVFEDKHIEIWFKFTDEIVRMGA